MSEERFEAAHLDGLGMGASRHNEDDPRNARANVVASHKSCHRRFDRLPPEEQEEIAAVLRAAIECPSGHGSRRFS